MTSWPIKRSVVGSAGMSLRPWSMLDAVVPQPLDVEPDNDLDDAGDEGPQSDRKHCGDECDAGPSEQPEREQDFADAQREHEAPVRDHVAPAIEPEIVKMPLNSTYQPIENAMTSSVGPGHAHTSTPTRTRAGRGDRPAPPEPSTGR